ncbi:unnamed protein product, partial [Symbiodinium microadriaticum]
GVLDYPLLTTQERGSVGWRTCVDPLGAQAMTRYEVSAADTANILDPMPRYVKIEPIPALRNGLSELVTCSFGLV